MCWDCSGIKIEKLDAKPNGWGAIIVNINRKNVCFASGLYFLLRVQKVKFPVFSLRAIKPIFTNQFVFRDWRTGDILHPATVCGFLSLAHTKKKKCSCHFNLPHDTLSNSVPSFDAIVVNEVFTSEVRYTKLCITAYSSHNYTRIMSAE